MADNSANAELTPGIPVAGESSGRVRRPRTRAFYSIGEVCSMIGVKPHVLRYWESQFRELSPAKNRSGNRVYQTREIELIALIHTLVHEQRYTVEGARKRLAELREEGMAAEDSAQSLQRVFLRSLGEELKELSDLLDPAR
ncbi:MAG: MerR family transcriptional regulator [Gemmatimonadota bacterium]|nr:MerR family transcriptional regulator [Gemmatimonadota bacterium]